MAMYGNVSTVVGNGSVLETAGKTATLATTPAEEFFR